MKKRALLIVFTAIFLVVAALLFAFQVKAQSFSPFSLEVFYGGNTEIIDLWEDPNKNLYAFLPSGVSLSQACLHLNTENPVYLNGEHLKEGASCSPYTLNKALSLEYKNWGKTYQTNLTFMQSENVATMYIDTASGTMDYIHAKKGNSESGKMRLYLPDGTLNCSEKIESMNGRGNNTWESFIKKPYSLKLESEENLLGMGYASKWILLANASDSSNLRNKLIYDFANIVGIPFSPDSQWVSLYLNNEYFGLYLLSERIEVHSNRVNISRNNSFLVSSQPEDRLIDQHLPYISTNADQALRIHFPENPSENELQRINQTWQSIENSILSSDGKDSDSQKKWSQLIDVESWARKYLLEEIFSNGDACHISQYYFSDNNGRVYAGPVWDMDHTLAYHTAWQYHSPNAFYANRLHVYEGFETPWFHELYQNDDFFSVLTDLYIEEFLPALNTILDNTLSVYFDKIRYASYLNEIRWTLDESIDTEIAYIKNYLDKRISFLNSVWVEKKEYLTVRADQKFGVNYGYFAVESGQCLTELPIFEDTETLSFVGWYREDTNEPFDASQPIYEDINIYAKWQDKPSRTLGSILKLIPLGIIGLMSIFILCIDIRRTKRNR